PRQPRDTRSVPDATAVSYIGSLRRPRYLFSSSGPTGDLHSFPTRRSSDLAQVLLGRFGLLVGGVVGLGLGPRLTRADDRGRVSQDRKSTRLNSSHRTISYAVFCLKKNKTALLLSGSAGRGDQLGARNGPSD